MPITQNRAATAQRLKTDAGRILVPRGGGEGLSSTTLINDLVACWSVERPCSEDSLVHVAASVRPVAAKDRFGVRGRMVVILNLESSSGEEGRGISNEGRVVGAVPASAAHHKCLHYLVGAGRTRGNHTRFRK